jgi:hypothetical protein
MPDLLDTARDYLSDAEVAADATERGRATGTWSREMAPVKLDHALRMATAYALLSIAESLGTIVQNARIDRDV